MTGSEQIIVSFTNCVLNAIKKKTVYFLFTSLIFLFLDVFIIMCKKIKK